MTRRDVSGRFQRRSLLIGTTCLALALIASPVWAAKWTKGCPRISSRLHKVGKGSFGHPYAGSRFFEHVGHPVTYQLKANDVVRHGGFSTEPDGNTVEVIFTPLEGEPIALPPFPVTAVSSSALTFVIPDSRPILGRLVVGPARIVVRRGTTVMFEANRQVILPPMNDIQALAGAGGEVEVLAAMDPRGRVWIPIDFSGFGSGPVLPECPAPMTPMVAFGIDLALKKKDGQVIPHASIRDLGKNRLFLGDFAFSDLNLYGYKLPARLSMKRLPGTGFSLCAANDTFQLVFMVPLGREATRPGSDVLPVVSDGSPLVVRLRNISADPVVAPVLSTLTEDDLGLPCE